MPIDVANASPTLFIRRPAFERAGLTRAAIDERLNLTADEFRIEGDLIAVGPIVGGDALTDVIAEFEEAGLVYYEDFYELSGNWPPWLRLFAMSG